MCVQVLKCRQLQVGLCRLTPTAVADKNGGPRALRIEVGHGHAAPLILTIKTRNMNLAGLAQLTTVSTCILADRTFLVSVSVSYTHLTLPTILRV